MRGLGRDSAGCRTARLCGDLDQGLDCGCKSGQVSAERASIGLITGNYSLGALQNKSPSWTNTFILYKVSKRANTRRSDGVPRSMCTHFSYLTNWLHTFDRK